jgi:hypothetical protein
MRNGVEFIPRPLPGSLLDEVEREEAVFQALDTCIKQAMSPWEDHA